MIGAEHRRGNGPAVSVVMATYNRSNIIGYSIESVRRSTLADWELIVVGDACTDDTEAVVATFNDPRIRFVNLPRNHGEQSGPNNEGVKQARGRYIAFLNHDDLWFPDHLACSLATLKLTGADLVFGNGVAVAEPGGDTILIGAEEAGTWYTPLYHVPASLWVMRKELAANVGPWCSAWSLRTIPSMDWLHRAWKQGAELRASHHLAAVIIPSGNRRGCYSASQSSEHAHYAARMTAPEFVAAIGEVVKNQSRLRASAANRMKLLCKKSLLGMGVLPPMPRYLLSGWRRGAFLRSLRRTRGLPPEPVRSDQARIVSVVQ